MKPLTKNLTAGQAAMLVGVAPSTLKKWTKNLGLRSWCVPGSNHQRIDASDLVEFLVKNEVPVSKKLQELVDQ